jgi:hypothetical protein
MNTILCVRFHCISREGCWSSGEFGAFNLEQHNFVFSSPNSVGERERGRLQEVYLDLSTSLLLVAIFERPSPPRHDSP